MNMPLKTFLFWLAITCLVWVVARIQYELSGTSFRWKYYKDINIVAALHHVLLWVGGICTITYFILTAGKWWFNL